MRVAERVAQRRELVGVPAVVLVAQRDQLGLGRRQPQRALEVAVEARRRSASATATKRSSPRDRRARAPANRSGLEPSSLITQTQRRSVCARSDSIWAREAAPGRARSVAMQTAISPAAACAESRRGGRRGGDLRSVPSGAIGSRPPARRAATADSPGRRRGDRHRAPEAAAERPAARRASWTSGRGMPTRRRPMRAPPSTSIQARDPLLAVEAGARAEHRGGGARPAARPAAGSRGWPRDRRTCTRCENLSFRAMTADPLDVRRAGSPDAERHHARPRGSRAPPAPGRDAEALRARLPRPAQARAVRPGGHEPRSRSARAPDGTVVSRELRGEERRLRAAGMDWPLHGLTMVGLGRLDDLQACVESVVADGVEGDLIEAGAWRGGASICSCARRSTRSATTARSGWPTRSGASRSRTTTTRRPHRLSALRLPRRARRGGARRASRASAASAACEFVPGFFEDTLPGLAGPALGARPARRRHLRADAAGARLLYPGLSVGGYMVVDDYGAFRAAGAPSTSSAASTGSPSRSSGSTSPASRWRRAQRRAGPLDRPVAAACSARARRERSGRRGHVPTRARVELEREVAALRGAAGRAPRREIGLRAWLRRRLGEARDDRLRLARSPTRRSTSVRRARDPARRRARLRGARQRRRRVDLPLLQPDPGHGRRARRPRGARAPPPGRRDRRPGLLRRSCAQALARPRGRRRRLRRRDRRAQHRLVGGLGDLGLVRPPLRGARRRRAARRSPGTAEELPPYARTGEVDTVDGFVLALSPWAVRNVRFDESLGQLHGYDFDFCLQVRAAGTQGRRPRTSGSSTTTRSS